MKISKKLIIGILVVGIMGSVFFSMNKKVHVKVSKVRKGNVVKYIEETGTIKAIEQEKIYSKIRGTLSKIYVKEGDLIDESLLLAQIDTKDNSLTMKGINEKINLLKSQYETNKKQAELKVDKNKANYDEAKRKLDSTKKLYEERVVSLDEYKKTLNQYVIAENLLESSKEELKKYISQEVTNSYESQINELKYELEKLKNKESDGNIYADKKGKILDVLVKENEYVTEGTSLFEMGNTDKYHMEVDVLGEDVVKLQNGGEVLIEDEDLGVNLQGTISKIYPKAFTKVSDLGIDQKRVKVDIHINGDTSKLMADYEVDVKLIEDMKEDVLILSKNSVFKYKDGDYVFLVEDNRAKLREVELGLKGQDNVEIIKGLKVGDMVILSPSDEIKENIKVNVE
ncbi:MAG: efflux RND transporter periplasmic adaptor subunit [Anaeromicrobium sp.]|uniref:efflux RND transporter periplasmic adaptor subunit n=1 Tax=Anaeromicrobium sp. TaxID=1929132 RepID=UPI0025CD79B3|nr:efflux RND transporter periplasmic adaptor subunit [Anaeromicrobium sp.]MCT4595503.1 efflux RND transporter periplasmic adaptor subunit [Anaeromicrobium sp.]